jgi:glycosyltransferase involved in cell wall biosynthesis
MHGHFTSGTDMALAVNLFSGIPFSFSAHASGDIFVRPPLLKEKLKRARFVVAVCDYSRKYLDSVTDFAFSQKIFRIYNGIEISEPERFLNPAGRGHPEAACVSSAVKIVSVGRLLGCKGYATLIEACRILKDRGHQIVCEIIGEGPEEEMLAGFIRRKNLGDVVFLSGPLPLERVYEALARADIFALLCEIHLDGFRDGFPTVIQEAMLMSLPVVSTYVSGIPEMVVPSETGFLVHERDAAGAATALEKLMFDADLRRRLGRAGRERVLSFFNVNRNVKSMDGLIRRYSPPGRENRALKA